MIVKRGIDKAVEPSSRSSRSMLEAGRRTAADRAGRPPSPPTDRRRRDHRRGDGQGRQGRRHHGRGGQDARDHARRYVEGMQFDRGYLSPLLRDRPRADGGGPREPVHPHHEKKISHEGPAAAAREGRQRASRCDRRRGRRRRGAGHAGRQQAARHAAGAAPSRRPASAIAARRCSRTSRSSPAANVITEELGRKLENVTLEDLGRAKRVVATKDNTTIVEGAGAQADDRRRA
jgi:hypothetical protein